MTTNWLKAVLLTALLIGATACSSEQKADQGEGNLLTDIGDGIVEVINLIPFVGDAEDEAPPEPPLLADVDATTDLGYRVQWQIDLGMTGSEHIEMVTPLPGRRLAILESGNIIHLVDARSGNTLWRRSISKGGRRAAAHRLQTVQGCGAAGSAAERGAGHAASRLRPGRSAPAASRGGSPRHQN